MASSFRYLQVVCVLLISGNYRVFGYCAPFDGVYIDDFEHNNGKPCFLTSKMKMTWAEARNYCDHFGFNSLAIRDDENVAYRPTTAVVQKYLNFLQQPGDYWTGATDLIEEGVWYWENLQQGSLVNKTHNAWAPGRPLRSKKFNCLYIQGGPGKLLWYDGNCRAKKFPLCSDYY